MTEDNGLTAGSLCERQERLVALAKALGFEHALPAWHAGVVVHPVRPGLFLGERVCAVTRWSDGCGGEAGDEIEFAVFDTREAAEAWVGQATAKAETT